MPPREKKKSAYSLALEQVQEKEQRANGNAVQNSNTVKNSNAAQDSNTVQNSEAPQSGKTGENRKTAKNSTTAKITIYPTQAQVDKLYDLMEAYRRKTGFKINQQDMIRRLIDLASEDTVLP